MYRLVLTEEDIATIAFVGARYCWSEALSSMGEGENDIPEHEAWEIVAEFHADAFGGHSFFPMLRETCELAGKLFRFMKEIV